MRDYDLTGGLAVGMLLVSIVVGILGFVLGWAARGV